ncbi:nucleotide-binding protein, partial [bacterium]|nr:nucleotide-binding protein [bacterium]
LETLPRRVALPPALHGAEPWRPGPTRTVFADPLRGAPGDLDGRDLPGGGATWRRTFGRGALDVGPDGARWRASVAAPLPGRTLYTIAWDDPDFAELEVTLTPPGTSRGQSEHGTAGFCLWQDDGHHLLVNTWLDDCYGGASLSSFPTIGGFEDLYDAIWTNVGDRIAWGRPLRLRLACDGLRYLVHIDDEPVLYRSLADIYPGCRPLRIRRVGLLGNWEWGADTGTAFADFAARRRDGSRADDAR